MRTRFHLNEASFVRPAGERKTGRQEERSRAARYVGFALMLNVLLWFLISCSGDIGSVMGLDEPASEIAGIHVEPASTTLEVGESEVLSALYANEKGEEHPEEVTWASMDPEIAEVNSDGEVTARTPGTAVIVASVDAGEDGSATVEVVDDGEGASGSGAGSHEPDGFAGFTERSFDEAVEDGWTASGDFDMKIVSDGSAPRSPSSVGQIRYPTGFEGGRTPTFTTRSGLEGEDYRKLYISFWVKLSENWQGHETRVNKVGFIWMHDNPVVVPNNNVKDSGPIGTEIRLQDTPAGSRHLTANLGAKEIKRGKWHHWEIVLVANSGSSQDGEAHWWIDGEKVGEYTDVIYGDSGQSKAWQIVAWRPTWGGRGDVVEAEMHMWMDHMYVSGAR